jgi:hypothetical protein
MMISHQNFIADFFPKIQNEPKKIDFFPVLVENDEFLVSQLFLQF